MSAIWGIISWGAPLPQTIKEQMQLPFQKKCKIDRYSSVQKDTVFMGCGIQYLTDESLSEVLPYTSGSPAFFMTAGRTPFLAAASCLHSGRHRDGTGLLPLRDFLSEIFPGTVFPGGLRFCQEDSVSGSRSDGFPLSLLLRIRKTGVLFHSQFCDSPSISGDS